MGANLPSPPQDAETALTTAPLERVCARVVLCNKNIAMYPQSHPRVAASLEQIRATLAAYRQETGTIFSLDTEMVLEEPECRQDPCAKRERLGLARNLQLHLIARLQCDANTTTQELFELCFLLQEDFLRKAAEETDVRGCQEITETFRYGRIL